MYQEKQLVFIYAISPVHMGSGTSLGVIDNPIQRECHTGHPILAGSGIKGAAREFARTNNMGEKMVKVIFGPETNASDHAGAVSFSDGQIVAFPVRSLREGFVYVTSPTALSRLLRLAQLAGISIGSNIGASVLKSLELHDSEKQAEAIVMDDKLLSDGKLVLESYEYVPKHSKKNSDEKTPFEKIAQWLSTNALPKGEAYSFFRQKLKKHLVVVSDTQFVHFVTNATLVEPHVRIDDTTGTSDEGGLFFTENVPPESIFVSLVMATEERKRKGSIDDGPLAAEAVMKKLSECLDEKMLQIGGDATTGRGQVVLRFVGPPGGKGGDGKELEVAHEDA